jgi:hypothetical protein
MPARSPGPIAAPEPLLATLTEYRQLHLALAEVEPGHPWLTVLEQPTELELDAVVALEATLDAGFSDVVLAMFASHVPHLEEQFEMQLAGLAALAEEARAVGCPAELLAIARQADLFLCVPRHEHPWATTAITPWHPLDGAGTALPLARWLKDVAIDDLRDLLTELDAIDPAYDELPPDAGLEWARVHTPMLVLSRTAVVAAAPRVQHSKFGVGRVLRSTGGGDARKLEIDFGPAGVRTILARFVTELPPES